MYAVNVPLVRARREEQVHRLTLADELLAHRRVVHHPGLVELERRLEDGLGVLVQELQVLHRAVVQDDRLPHLVGVVAGLLKHALEVGVLD